MNYLNDDGSRSRAAREGMAGLFTLAALLGNAMDRGLADRGLTRARGEVIWTLHHQGPMTQRRLSQALDCSAPNVTGLLDGLEAAGFVRRGPHPTDRRATLVDLTELGTTMASTWSSGFDDLADSLFADLATPELTSFVNRLEEVLARLREAMPPRSADGQRTK